MAGKPAKGRLEGLTGELTVTEAAEALGVHIRFVRAAIAAGKLPARLPFGKTDPTRAGRGKGYRIKPADLSAWYFGKE